MFLEWADYRKRIIDAAMELFAERGFEGTPDLLIAERANLPTALIGYYFGSKGNLFDALLGERMPTFSHPVERGSDLRLALIEIGTEFHATLQQNEPFVRILLQEAHLRPAAQQMMYQMREHVLTLLRTLLEDAQRQGKLRSVDTEMVAQIVFSSILVDAGFQERADPHAWIERLMTVLLGE